MNQMRNLSKKQRWLVCAEAWMRTGDVWESVGISRRPDDLQMWQCLLAWAGMPE